MGLLARIFGTADEQAMASLYASVVEAARRPGWYAKGGVSDTIDGRFDMVALVLSLVLLRLEREGAAGRRPSVQLTERFVEDMDGQLRESGFGDLVVGKRVGFAMGALGGRLGAYRGGIDDAALVRNLWRGEAPAPDALATTRAMIANLRQRIDAAPLDSLLAGQWA